MTIPTNPILGPSSVAVPACMNILPSTSSLQGATRFSRNISQHKKARISIIALYPLYV